MEFAIAIWNFLWDNQLWVAFAIVLVLWLAVRGFDFFRWLIRKASGRTPANDADPIADVEESEE